MNINNILLESGSTQENINTMTCGEKFAAVLNYEGFINCDSLIKNYVKEIYNVDLNNIQEKGIL